MDQEEKNALRRAAKTIAEHADDARFERWARVAELLIATGAARPNDYDSNSALGQLVTELNTMREVLGSPLQVVEAHLGVELLADVAPRLRAELEKTRSELEACKNQLQAATAKGILQSEAAATLDTQAAERMETLAHELRLARDKIANLERSLRRARAGVFDPPTDADIRDLANRLRTAYDTQLSLDVAWYRVARVALGLE